MSDKSPTSGSHVVPAPLAPVVFRNWYAVYTCPNHEKRVEKHFRIEGLESYLPLYRVKRRWKNRTTVVLEIPLFPGYLFVRIAQAEQGRVLEFPSVLSLVGNGWGPVSLPEP